MTRVTHVLGLLLLISVGCAKGDARSSSSGSNARWAPEKLKSVDGVPIADIETAIKRRLGAARPAHIDNDQWGHVRRIYRIYSGSPLWLTSRGLHPKRTKTLTNALLNAENDGMRMDVYPIGELANAIATVKEGDKPTAEELAQADVILTSAYAALGEDLLTGQLDPRSFSQSWYIDPEEDNVDSALVRTLRFDALDKGIATMRPQDDDYAGLMKALAVLREVVVGGGWGRVPAGKSLKIGDTDKPARIAALRNRLTAEGFPPAEVATDTTTRAKTRTHAARSGAVFNRGLAAALAEFQEHHGIVVDSALGTETLDALNVGADYRLAQVAANLERYRWLPRLLGNRYIFVNVPAFRLEVVENGQKALEMKVIVGEEYEGRRTPVFSDMMEYIIFRPYWNVPPKIAANEIFPKMSSGYLAANHYELYTENGETRVRQRPGDKNALGLVKFLFPNDFNIYLHDTPFDELFEKDVRAFSHGCIRLEKPVQLASLLLGWDISKVENEMHNGPDDHRVNLPRRIPVYIAYFTAYLRDGKLYFGNDLYNRDDRLAQEVYKGAMPSPETVQAVQALRKIAAD
ncbi:MAG TPA: L,D-transpeptidase family protein [Gemmatimonadaceae bacterium]